MKLILETIVFLIAGGVIGHLLGVYWMLLRLKKAKEKAQQEEKEILSWIEENYDDREWKYQT